MIDKRQEGTTSFFTLSLPNRWPKARSIRGQYWPQIGQQARCIFAFFAWPVLVKVSLCQVWCLKVFTFNSFLLYGTICKTNGVIDIGLHSWTVKDHRTAQADPELCGCADHPRKQDTVSAENWQWPVRADLLGCNMRDLLNDGIYNRLRASGDWLSWQAESDERWVRQ